MRKVINFNFKNMVESEPNIIKQPGSSSPDQQSHYKPINKQQKWLQIEVERHLGPGVKPNSEALQVSAGQVADRISSKMKFAFTDAIDDVIYKIGDGDKKAIELTDVLTRNPQIEFHRILAQRNLLTELLMEACTKIRHLSGEDKERMIHFVQVLAEIQKRVEENLHEGGVTQELGGHLDFSSHLGNVIKTQNNPK